MEPMDKDLEKVMNDLQQKRNSQSGKPLPKNTDNPIKPEQLEYAGIYKRYQGVTFESIEAKGLPQNMSIRSAYWRAKKYAEDIEEMVKQGRGLVLVGGYGTMKTTIVVAILREWLTKGHGGMIVPMCSLMDNLFTMRTLNREEMARYEQRLRKVPLLILDDLGGEDTDQKWILDKVDAIVTERYNEMLPTIITTNLSPKELEQTYSERIIDRLNNSSELLVVVSRSLRQPLDIKDI